MAMLRYQIGRENTTRGRVAIALSRRAIFKPTPPRSLRILTFTLSGINISIPTLPPYLATNPNDL
ncbi:hypothetical protein N7455_004228 [Penicillium solitum]|uniref:uncharacterized protein n=1 Tax=Penicillium solitum TaxID=60172 RepID=UPI0032C3DD48|nr:hypothetical protein N7455_004228 [Penicillium solitum]